MEFEICGELGRVALGFERLPGIQPLLFHRIGKLHAREIRGLMNGFRGDESRERLGAEHSAEASLLIRECDQLNRTRRYFLFLAQCSEAFETC